MTMHSPPVLFAESDQDKVERLIKQGGAALAALAALLASGQITNAQFIERATVELRQHAHHAANLAGGGLAASSAVDSLIDERSAHLDGFAAAIASGLLSAKQLEARADHWAGLVHTAHQISVRHSDTEATWDWELDPAAAHCEDPDGNDCPSFAEGGPYAAGEEPADPGDGTTPCGGYCRCRWKRHVEEEPADFSRIVYGPPLHFADGAPVAANCLCGMAYVLRGDGS